jgi:hypothetical protein
VIYHYDRTTWKEFDSDSTPVTPLEVYEDSIKCRRIEIQKLKAPHHRYQGTYKIFETQHSYESGNSLDVVYTYHITDKMMEIVGIIRQNNRTIDVIKLKKNIARDQISRQPMHGDVY